MAIEMGASRRLTARRQPEDLARRCRRGLRQQFGRGGDAFAQVRDTRFIRPGGDDAENLHVGHLRLRTRAKQRLSEELGIAAYSSNSSIFSRMKPIMI